MRRESGHKNVVNFDAVEERTLARFPSEFSLIGLGNAATVVEGRSGLGAHEEAEVFGAKRNQQLIPRSVLHEILNGRGGDVAAERNGDGFDGVDVEVGDATEETESEHCLEEVGEEIEEYRTDVVGVGAELDFPERSGQAAEERLDGQDEERGAEGTALANTRANKRPIA